MKQIHERLIEVRKYFNMSQDDAANATGLSQNGISLIEKGKRQKPNLEYIDFWIREKNVSYNWLIHNKGDMIEESNNKYDKNEIDEIIEENSYLKSKIQDIEKRFEKRLEEQRINFLQMIHDISGKPSEHKKAANPNEIQNSILLGLSYVPASINI